ncbi:hypothetical protein M422DRAFT_62634 [Sphaerobolus stellatus SS14]|nr:hypothetical protein M422DRAFT_62634 [Sphaerobolus stellatus SS14]
MPPGRKRKVQEQLSPIEEHNGPRTRSRGPPQDDQSSPTKKQRKAPTIRVIKPPKQQASKQKNTQEADGSSGDELNLRDDAGDAVVVVNDHTLQSNAPPRTPKSILKSTSFPTRTSTSPSPSVRQEEEEDVRVSPKKQTQPITPTKQTATFKNASPQKFRLPHSLPLHLAQSLNAQKTAVLKALQRPSLIEYEASPYPQVFSQLKDLVAGTIERHEGNSCLILGPRGSGKTRLVEELISSIPSSSSNTPIIIRLSAYAQTNDRLAMREIARQVQEQIGPTTLMGEEGSMEEEDENDLADMNLLAPAHLPSIIGALPCLGRPVIIILDAFDGFAGHARQALLYCLLDTVQSCRGGTTPVQLEDSSEDITKEPNGNITTEGKQPKIPSESRSDAKGEHGLLVIGLTSRVDCLNILEKRVKSRFSHRVLRVGGPPKFEVFRDVLKTLLNVQAIGVSDEWTSFWEISVQNFLEEKPVVNLLNETFAFGKDIRALCRLMISPIINLSQNSPWLTHSRLSASISTQRCPRQFPFLASLAYPQMSLLIAALHSQVAGQEIFNFEMLFDRFFSHSRLVAATPMQTERLGLGMMHVSKPVMFGAFEDLVSHQIFKPVVTPVTHITKEFAKYRCLASRESIKNAVEQRGQTSLIRWLGRNQ